MNCDSLWSSSFECDFALGFLGLCGHLRRTISVLQTSKTLLNELVDPEHFSALMLFKGAPAQVLAG